MRTLFVALAMCTLGATVVSGCAARLPQPPVWQPVVPLPPQIPPTPGAIYNVADAQPWFGADRADRVGDIVTIVLEEETQASKKAETTTSKQDSSNLGGVDLFGHTLPSNGGNVLGLSSKRGFDGTGASSQSDQLNGEITATVTRRLSNGNLVVKGQAWIVINQGSELIRLIGVIRPADISSDNTILSTRVADARIAYTGKGTLENSNVEGWLTQFFNSRWAPF